MSQSLSAEDGEGESKGGQVTDKTAKVPQSHELLDARHGNRGWREHVELDAPRRRSSGSAENPSPPARESLGASESYMPPPRARVA